MLRVQVTIEGAGRFREGFERAAFAAVEAGAGTLYEFCQDKLDTYWAGTASKLGEAPRRRSGDGRRACYFEAVTAPEGLGGPEARCGTTSERLIEQGREDFNYMAHWERNGRPWLLPALTENQQAIGAAMESAAKAEMGL